MRSSLIFTSMIYGYEFTIVENIYDHFVYSYLKYTEIHLSFFGCKKMLYNIFLSLIRGCEIC